MKSFDKASESLYQTLSSTKDPVHLEDVTHPPLTTPPAVPHSMDSQIIVTILALTSLAVAIAIGIIFIKIWKRCHKSRNENYGSTTVQQSLLGIKGKGEVEDLEMDTAPSIAYDEIINMASDICLGVNDLYLCIVACNIDSDYKPLFATLNVGKQVVYQEQQRAITQGEGISELCMAILNRWVGQYGREAKLSVLYSALHSNGYNKCCRKILEKLQVLNNVEDV